ncbi:MAG: beta-ketoacyl-ACP synthase, partial [Armatimonadetes bacterium]|nr:beta-ketoacyl-ACP synthase [Armatimonadota bacterium]
MRRVVITGQGVVSSLGVGVERFWTRLSAGQSGLRPIQRFDTAGLRNELGGEVPEEEWQAGAYAAAPRPLGYAAAAC